MESRTTFEHFSAERNTFRPSAPLFGSSAQHFFFYARFGFGKLYNAVEEGPANVRFPSHASSI
jgi:hypothetical protein